MLPRQPRPFQAYEDAQWRETMFGVTNNTATAIGYVPDLNSTIGVLGHLPLTELFGVYTLLNNFTIGSGQSYSPDLCSRSCAQPVRCSCNVVSVFPVFSGLTGDTTPSSMTIPPTDAQILQRIRSRTAFQGVPILDAVLGNVTRNAAGEVTGANAVLMQFEISDMVSRESQVSDTLVPHTLPYSPHIPCHSATHHLRLGVLSESFTFALATLSLCSLHSCSLYLH